MSQLVEDLGPGERWPVIRAATQGIELAVAAAAAEIDGQDPRSHPACDRYSSIQALEPVLPAATGDPAALQEVDVMTFNTGPLNAQVINMVGGDQRVARGQHTNAEQLSRLMTPGRPLRISAVRWSTLA